MKLDYIENYSSGLNRIFKEHSKSSKKPKIETAIVMFKIIFPNLNYRVNKKIIEDENVHQNVCQNVHQNEPLNDHEIAIENKICELIKTNSHITREEISNKLAKSKSTIYRIIKKSDKIKYVGSGKKGNWIVKEEKIENVGVNVGVKLSETQNKILSEIKSNPAITYRELALNVSKSEETIRRGVKFLVSNKLIKRVGSDKSGHWEIIS